jgi:plasmid stability protein
MAVNLSIKNIPEDVVAGLRNRAARNQRSLNSEVLHILAQAAQGQAPVSLEDMLERAQRTKPGLDETATQIEARLAAERQRMARHFEDLWSKPDDADKDEP